MKNYQNGITQFALNIGDQKYDVIFLHPLSNEKSNKTVINLCKQLNETATVFPGTELRLSYKLVSM